MNMLKIDYIYVLIRQILFWAFTLLFLVCAPVILFYSLGYKFDQSEKKFFKTGAVSIRSYPRGAEVKVNGVFKDVTPCVLRGFLPKEYSFSIEKKGFYSYTIPVEVKSDAIFDFEAVLVCKRKNVEKLKFNFDIYKFFINRNLWNMNILAFTDLGIYLFNQDFSEFKKITGQILDKNTAMMILDFRLENKRLIFWDKSNIWSVVIASLNGRNDSPIRLVYKSEEQINNVFIGLKERYLIVHDGLKVLAVDADVPKIVFGVYDLQSVNAVIFYDSHYEELYIKDKIPGGASSSLFKVKLAPIYPSIEYRLKQIGENN